jgi:hypothetical protein
MMLGSKEEKHNETKEHQKEECPIRVAALAGVPGMWNGEKLLAG